MPSPSSCLAPWRSLTFYVFSAGRSRAFSRRHIEERAPCLFIHGSGVCKHVGIETTAVVTRCGAMEGSRIEDDTVVISLLSSDDEEPPGVATTTVDVAPPSSAPHHTRAVSKDQEEPTCPAATPGSQAMPSPPAAAAAGVVLPMPHDELAEALEAQRRFDMRRRQEEADRVAAARVARGANHDVATDALLAASLQATASAPDALSTGGISSVAGVTHSGMPAADATAADEELARLLQAEEQASAAEAPAVPHKGATSSARAANRDWLTSAGEALKAVATSAPPAPPPAPVFAPPTGALNNEEAELHDPTPDIHVLFLVRPYQPRGVVLWRWPVT